MLLSIDQHQDRTGQDRTGQDSSDPLIKFKFPIRLSPPLLQLPSYPISPVRNKGIYFVPAGT